MMDVKTNKYEWEENMLNNSAIERSAQANVIKRRYFGIWSVLKCISLRNICSIF